MQAATETRERIEEGAAGSDLNATALFVGASFGWKPGAASRAVIKSLAHLMRPLEEGSYEGRPITGAPHRANWVIASPLTVFVLPSASYLSKLVLAARLGHTGPINVAEAASRGSAPTGPDPLEELIDIQRRSRVSLRLVPVAHTSHQLSPEAAGPSISLRAYRAAPQNIIRRAASLVRTVRTGSVKNCGPLVLSSWLRGRAEASTDELARALRIELMGNIASQSRACSGPPVMPVREVKRRVLADPVLAAYIQDHALEIGSSRDELLAEAASCIDEIASDYRVGVVRWFARAVDFLFDRVLTDLEVDRAGIRFLSECDSRSRLVLVCSHKSYLDPLLIGYTLFRSGMVPPQQAAGKNLDFWPVGWLLRHSGAFYLRRTFTGETTYREVVSAYVRYLLAENHIMVVYIEGTRSRDGKLALPRTGFMKILAESLAMGVCQDITLVPVYLGYDRVPEESAHVREMAGGRKVSESVKGFGRIYRSINTRLGRAYVKFATPLNMKRLLSERGLEGAALAACEGINSVTPITARSVASCALLSSGEALVRPDDVVRAAGVLLDYAREGGLPLAVDCDEDGIAAAIEWLRREGHVSREATGDGLVKVEGEGRRFLEYNKNICIHHYLDAAVAALERRGYAGDAVGDGTGLEMAAFLYRLFDCEFTSYPATAPGAMPPPNADTESVMASLLESYLECYRVAAHAAGSVPRSGISREDLVERCMAEGERMLRAGLIRRPESVSKTSVLNAIRHFASCGMLEQHRARVEGKADVVSLSPGPRFDELAKVEETLVRTRS